jgi:hypothetical protein
MKIPINNNANANANANPTVISKESFSSKGELGQ